MVERDDFNAMEKVHQSIDSILNYSGTEGSCK